MLLPALVRGERQPCSTLTRSRKRRRTSSSTPASTRFGNSGEQGDRHSSTNQRGGDLQKPFVLRGPTVDAEQF